VSFAKSGVWQLQWDQPADSIFSNILHQTVPNPQRTSRKSQKGSEGERNPTSAKMRDGAGA
jgi:hypothetical protein